MSLNKNNLLDLFIKASKLMVVEPDKYENLIFTQERDGKQIIREPEATYSIANELSKKGVTFGLEVPTGKKYKIKGSKPDSANTDLAIEPTGKQINVEFKCDQPKPEDIEKDILKLLGEDVSGTAFFHILKNYNRGTMPTLLKKFETSFINLKNYDDVVTKWFLLFFFVKEKKECFWIDFYDITNIPQGSFEIKNLNKMVL